MCAPNFAHFYYARLDFKGVVRPANSKVATLLRVAANLQTINGPAARM